MKSIVNLMCPGVRIIASIPRELSSALSIYFFHLLPSCIIMFASLIMVVLSISIVAHSSQVFVTGRPFNSRGARGVEAVSMRDNPPSFIDSRLSEVS